MAIRQIASTGEIVEDNKQPDEKPKVNDEDLQLRVKVHSPFKVYFDGEAKSVSAENDTGPFDVLPKHHNFLTLLNACDIVIRTDQTKQQIRISRGVMHVRKDQVTIFLDV